MIRTVKIQKLIILGFLMIVVFGGNPAWATIDGLTGTTFNFTAKPGFVLASEGSSILMWGYGVDGNMQYPGPTLILNEGDLITITVTNQLPVPTSIVFPDAVLTTSLGLIASPLIIFSAAGITPRIFIGKFALDAANIVPATTAAPDISPFISSIPCQGLMQ